MENKINRNIRIATSEEILSILSSYDKIFSKEILDYINALVYLEISILEKGYLSDKSIEALTGLEPFRKIAIYNIFKRLILLMEKEGIKVQDKNNCFGGIHLRLNTNYFSNILNFSFTTNQYSTIILNETIIDESVRNKRLEWLRLQQEREKKREEYSLLSLTPRLHINSIEREIEELEGRGEIDDNTRSVMEFQNKLGEAFLKDNGLKKEEFIEDVIEYKDIEPRMIKDLVKKYPHTKVVREIRYY